LIDRLSFLKGAEGGAVSAEEERLMQLFQNRAGLKKAYADLKDEFHLLRDRLKQQEGATIRVQEQLDALGDLLGDPKTGFGALVFFQLRALWKICHQQLSTFATDLTRQQEAREWRSTRRKATRRRARGSPMSISACRPPRRGRFAAQHLAPHRSEIGRLTAFWHYFKRRRRQKSLESLRSQVVAADAQVGDLHAERSAIEHEAAEDFPGISLAARRNINLAIISYAELLCEHVDAYGLAARAKEAVARRVHEMNFGTREECEGYMQRVQKAQAAVANQKQITVALKVKLDRLRAQLRIPQQRRHRAQRRLAGGQSGGAELGKTGKSATAARLERARRGLLGPVHAAIALAGRRAPVDCRCAAPAWARLDAAAPSPRPDRPRSATPRPAGCPRLHRP
jgi:hypothetical protein